MWLNMISYCLALNTLCIVKQREENSEKKEERKQSRFRKYFEKSLKICLKCTREIEKKKFDRVW